MSLVYKPGASLRGTEIKIPCGQCIGCRIERSRQWAVRCLNEASLYEKNCFITLTYDYEHLPIYESVNLRDFQLFMKKLRKEHGEGIRYYHCGEYGTVCAACGASKIFCRCGQLIEKLGRPHYHALLFNFDFDDKKLISENNGNRLYRSSNLEKLWPQGFSTVGSVTYQSAGYVARYVMKKITGKKAYNHYGNLWPEYTSMSRKDGIGKKWFEKYKNDIYPSDELIQDGKPTKPPKYYDSLLDKENPEMYKQIVKDRKAKYGSIKTEFIDGEKIVVNDNDSFRLPIKEAVKQAQIKTLQRSI